jgi:hypothetical protein
LFPNLQSQAAMRFEEKISYAEQFCVPEYALQQYYQKPSQVRLASKNTVQKLVEIAISINKLQDVQNILIQRKDVDLNVWFYKEFLLVDQLKNFIEISSQDKPELSDNLRQTLLQLEKTVEELQPIPAVVPNKKEYPGDMIMQLIERWIKSPYDYQLLGQKLINLFKENPALSNLWWSREDLRKQILQGINRSMDYGFVVELIPNYLNQEFLDNQDINPIMKSLITLNKHNLCPSEYTILSEIVKNISTSSTINSKIYEEAVLLLPILRELNNNCFDLAEKFQLIQQAFQRLNNKDL